MLDTKQGKDSNGCFDKQYLCLFPQGKSTGGIETGRRSEPAAGDSPQMLNYKDKCLTNNINTYISDGTDGTPDGVGMEHRTKDNTIKDNTIKDNSIEHTYPSSNEQKNVGKGKRVFVPPTLQDMIDFKDKHNLSFNPQECYDYYVKMDWRDKNDVPVRNWKSKIS